MTPPSSISPALSLPSERLSATLTRQQCASKDSLYLHFPDKSREARGTLSAKTQRPAYLKHKNHASMPHLGQVPRPSTYADEVGRQRHPPAFKPKRSQSLTDAPMANQQSSATKDSKVEKHVHFIDEGYGSSATTPATSPKVSRSQLVAWLPQLTAP